MKRANKPVFLVAVVSLSLAGLQASAAAPSLRGPRLEAGFAKIPLQFIPNDGPLGGPAAFSVRGRDKTIHFASEGLTFVLNNGAGSGRWVVKLDFVGSNPRAVPAGLESSGAVFSYFKGRPSEWRTGLRASSRIIYRDLWPGIDLVCDGTVDRLKSSFVVRPGADPGKIRFAYRGAERVTLTDRGALAVTTSMGGFEDEAPQAWQESDGGRTAVSAAYRLGDEVGLDLGPYDPSRPLVIDPTVLVYCGFIGGTNWDFGNGVAVDGSGCAYVTGTTSSSEDTFPVKAGPDLTYNGFPEDIFVAKVSADGTGLVYCGYIGGAGTDSGTGIAVDSSGCAYIAGRTNSTDFPVTSGSLLVRGGGDDAVVAKINASGTGLDYSGCLGGAADDLAYGIALDGAGCAYVVGRAISLPQLKAGPDLTPGGPGGFIAKVNATGLDVVYCGYIGAGFAGTARAVAVDAAGSAYVTGDNAYVAKVKADGTGLEYSGSVRGQRTSNALGIAVDGEGNAYVTGWTESDATTFPLKVGPDLTWNGGYRDAFVAKLNADGSLCYSGYIGGDDNDTGLGIAVDGKGNAYVIGVTGSAESTFPVREGPDMTWNGSADAFVAKVDPAGTGLIYCGYVGGEYDEEPNGGIAVDGGGGAYIAGATRSGESTFPVRVGPRLTASNPTEAFAAKLSAFDVPAASLGSLSPVSAVNGDPALTVILDGTGFENGSVVMWDGRDLPTTFVSATELRAEAGADLLQIVGMVAVTVRNPNGGVSNAKGFTVNNAPPVLTSLSPANVVMGSAGFNLVLAGSGFVPGAVVLWGGEPRTTTFVSGTQLQAAILAADIDEAGRVPVTVVNPAPGGVSSAAVEFAVISFSFEVTPLSVAVEAGETATYTIKVTAQYGPYSAQVFFNDYDLPRGCWDTFTPGNVIPGEGSATATLKILTTRQGGGASGTVSAGSGLIPPGMALLLLVLAVALRRLFRRAPLPVRARRWAQAAACAVLLVTIAGCTAKPKAEDWTPVGTYQIYIEAVSGNLAAYEVVDLVVN